MRLHDLQRDCVNCIDSISEYAATAVRTLHRTLLSVHFPCNIAAFVTVPSLIPNPSCKVWCNIAWTEIHEDKVHVKQPMHVQVESIIFCVSWQLLDMSFILSCTQSRHIGAEVMSVQLQAGKSMCQKWQRRVFWRGTHSVRGSGYSVYHL